MTTNMLLRQVFKDPIMMDCFALRCEAVGLRNCIERLHVLAWQHRVSKNVEAMKAAHRCIRSCQKRIEACESEIKDEEERFKSESIAVAIYSVVMGVLLILICEYENLMANLLT